MGPYWTLLGFRVCRYFRLSYIVYVKAEIWWDTNLFLLFSSLLVYTPSMTNITLLNLGRSHAQTDTQTETQTWQTNRQYIHKHFLFKVPLKPLLIVHGQGKKPSPIISEKNNNTKTKNKTPWTFLTYIVKPLSTVLAVLHTRKIKTLRTPLPMWTSAMVEHRCH